MRGHLTHLDLFTGIGGFSLAAEWAGFRHVAFCERDPYCQSVLRWHWPEVPIIGDVHAVTTATIREPVDLLTGGVPCQPRSLAGKRRGAADDRDLWPEMRRVVAEIHPRAVVVENPFGLISLDHEAWCLDLEAEGYEVGTVVLPAAAVGAPHIRDRVFLLAYADRIESQRERRPGCMGRSSGTSEGDGEEWERVRDATRNRSADVSNTTQHGRGSRRTRRPDPGSTGQRQPIGPLPDVADAEVQSPGAGLCLRESGRIGRGRSGDGGSADGDAADTNGIASLGVAESRGQCRVGQSEPGICRVAARFSAGLDGNPWGIEPVDVARLASGVPHRVERLRALGNAVVPAQAYPILQTIADWLRAEDQEGVA